MASHRRGSQHSLLSSHLARLLLWAIVLLSIVCRSGVHCAVLTTSVPEVNVTALGEGGGILDDATDIPEVSHDEEEEYSEDEEYEDHIPMKSFFIDDDSILVQPVIKPENTGESTGSSTGTTGKKGEKKNGDKKKKKGQNNKNKNKKNKKKNPCQTTHTDYCIHGECRYLAALQEVSCKCQPDFFGERCSDRSMPSATEKLSDITTTTVLAVVAVLLSTISIAAIIIIIVVHTRRKYASYHCEAEEKKRLEQENGSDEVDV